MSLLFAAFAFVFLLTLTNNFGLGWDFTFQRRCGRGFFLDDADRRNRGIGFFQDFDTFRDWNV